MIVKANPQIIKNPITSEPTTGEYKVKKIRMDTDKKTIMVTHSSVAES